MNWMRVMAKWWLAVMLLAFGLGAQAQQKSAGGYVLGSGDQIRITVFQNPDLTLETRIGDAGTISYPLLGTVKLGGLSIVEAEKKMAAGLKDGNFLKQPQVSIMMMAIRANQVSVLGQVSRPGQYGLEFGSLKLSEMIAMAGGVPAGAGSDIIVITGTRDNQPFRKEVDFPKVFAQSGGEPEFVLQHGDIVWVDRAPVIYMYGEVQRAGVQGLARDMTLLQALAAGGGLTLRGTERGIRVHRRDPKTGEVKVIQPAMNDKLMPNDVIYVKESLF